MFPSPIDTYSHLLTCCHFLPQFRLIRQVYLGRVEGGAGGRGIGGFFLGAGKYGVVIVPSIGGVLGGLVKRITSKATIRTNARKAIILKNNLRFTEHHHSCHVVPQLGSHVQLSPGKGPEPQY